MLHRLRAAERRRNAPLAAGARASYKAWVRLRGRPRSVNVEDRRGRGVGGRGIALGGGSILLVVVLALLFGADPAELLALIGEADVSGAPAPDPAEGHSVPGPRPDDEQADLVSKVLADTEQTWAALFAASGERYEPARLVLFDDAVRSACGTNLSAVGPFYCPPDATIYIDLGFFRELERRFGAPGDFAQAYVVAHEVGHHVQNLLGVSEEVRQRQLRLGEAGANALSVRLELQADCFAGVWGHHAGVERGLLEPGDAEEGLRAAAAIGDDRILRESTGSVRPESWTHGSSAERVRWLRQGLDTGDPEACATF